MDSNCNKSAEVNGGTPFAEARGSAADPRVGRLTPEDAAMLKKLAEDMGALDCMPAWMRDEIEAKAKPPNVSSSPATVGEPKGKQ